MLQAKATVLYTAFPILNRLVSTDAVSYTSGTAVEIPPQLHCYIGLDMLLLFELTSQTKLLAIEMRPYE